jgi:hypothetical protein
MLSISWPSPAASWPPGTPARRGWPEREVYRMNGKAAQAGATDTSERSAKTEGGTDSGPAGLATEIGQLRQRLMCPDTLNNPRIIMELHELYKQVAAVLDERRGRHRLQAGGAAPTAIPEPIRDAGGFNLKPDPLTARTGAELVARLREYREWSGKTPFRKMAAQARQKVSYSAMCVALKGYDLPGLQIVVAIIAGCGGGDNDQRAFATAWRRINSGRADAWPPAEAPRLRVLYAVAGAKGA